MSKLNKLKSGEHLNRKHLGKSIKKWKSQHNILRVDRFKHEHRFGKFSRGKSSDSTKKEL